MIKRMINWFINLFKSNKTLYLSEDNLYQWYDAEVELLRLLNLKRKNQLTADLNLYYFAKDRTRYLEAYPKSKHDGYFETVHILGDLGFEQTGECLTLNIKNTKKIMDSLMKSPSHAKILLDERYKYIGIGYHNAGRKNFTCLILGR